MKTPSEDDALYLEELVKTEDDKLCTLHSSNRWTTIPIRNVRLTITCSLTTTRSTFQTRSVRRKKFPRFVETPNGCVICSDTIPRLRLLMVLHTSDETETYTDTRVAVAFSLQTRNSGDEPWHEDERHSCCGCQNRNLARGNSWRHTDIANESQRQCDSKGPAISNKTDRTDSSRFLLKLWHREHHWQHGFSVRRT